MKIFKTALVLIVSFLFFTSCTLDGKKSEASKAETNKQVVLNWATELNKSNLAYLDKVIHPDFVDHNPFPNVPATKEGYISTLTKAHQEWFPGIQVEVLDILAEGDKVAFRVKVKAKHVGNVMGAKGTGKMLTWEAYGIYRVKDDQLIERWELLDSMNFMMQLGLAKMSQ